MWNQAACEDKTRRRDSRIRKSERRGDITVTNDGRCKDATASSPRSNREGSNAARRQRGGKGGRHNVQTHRRVPTKKHRRMLSDVDAAPAHEPTPISAVDAISPGPRLLPWLITAAGLLCLKKARCSAVCGCRWKTPPA